MGGGSSIDKNIRTPYINWWPEEIPNVTDWNNAYKNLESVNKVDKVFAHTMPLNITNRYIEDISGWQSEKQYKILETEFQAVIDNGILDFDNWYCGHWHPDNGKWTYIDFNKTYHCLYRHIEPLIF